MIPFLEQSHLDPDLKRKIEKNLEILQTKQLMKQLPRAGKSERRTLKGLSPDEKIAVRRERHAEYRKKNRVKINAYQKEYRRKRRAGGLDK